MERRQFMGLAGMLTAGTVLAPQVVFGSQNEISDITTVVDDSNFAKEVSGHKGKAIVLFYSMFEPYSPKIFPLFKELVKEYGDKAKFCSYELDESYNSKVNQNFKEKWEEVKNKYGISGIPTINMYVDGRLNDKVSGYPTEKVPEKVIKEFIIKWIHSH